MDGAPETGPHLVHGAGLTVSLKEQFPPLTDVAAGGRRLQRQRERRALGGSTWELPLLQLPGALGLGAQQLSGTVCPSLNEPDALHVKSVWPPWLIVSVIEVTVALASVVVQFGFGQPAC